MQFKDYLLPLCFLEFPEVSCHSFGSFLSSLEVERTRLRVL